MKIDFIKKRPSTDSVGDYRTNLVVLKDGVSFVDMKVDNESEIDQIVKLVEEMANTNENCVIIIKEEQV